MQTDGFGGGETVKLLCSLLISLPTYASNDEDDGEGVQHGGDLLRARPRVNAPGVLSQVSDLIAYSR